MAPSLGETWRSFWHTMTSNDRHASHDSPYRTGQHAPLNTGRHPPLTSISTTGIGSSADLNSPYADDTPTRSRTMLYNGRSDSPVANDSPKTPYMPGMRSHSARQGTPTPDQDGEGVKPGEIQLQNFHEGLPPPPPVGHSWKRIDRWAEDNYTELCDQMCEGATNNDLNELEHMMDCSLPLDVRESIQVHDGQERGGQPTGIIFGCMLLDCEEIVQEWQQWRRVNQDFFSEGTRPVQAPLKTAGGSSSSSSPVRQTSNPLWKQDMLARQDSQPSGAIQKAYAHPGWIPMARDWGGNNLAVDLAPGPAGKWGQVIIFGRDYDCKYVVARSWAAFLAMVADDMGSEKWFVDEETQELKLREFKTTTVEPGYLDILRWRMDQKYGRKGPRRKPGPGMSINPNATGGNNSNGGSPYGSPVGTEFERGRQDQRFNSHGSSSSSPRRHHPISSPLAKVSEEGSAAVAVRTSPHSSRDRGPFTSSVPSKPTKLVEVATPTVADTRGQDTPRKTNFMDASESDAMARKEQVEGLGVKGINGVEGTKADSQDGTLKTVEL
ncbi:MAG: Cell wall assembly regulator [Piccolia ochrophora]|nr:MAG: Cell wall assembly regulator [Piccolia ochrophora]